MGGAGGFLYPAIRGSATLAECLMLRGTYGDGPAGSATGTRDGNKIAPTERPASGIIARHEHWKQDMTAAASARMPSRNAPLSTSESAGSSNSRGRCSLV